MIWALVAVLSFDSIEAQNLFSILPDVGGVKMQGVCRTIVSDTNTFHIIGHRLDTNNAVNIIQPWLGEFNFNGELLGIHLPIDSVYEGPFYPDNIILAQKKGPLYYIYVPKDMGGTNYIPYLCEMNIHTGEITKSILLPNVDYPNDPNILCAINFYKDTLTLLSFAFVNDSYQLYLTQIDTLFENVTITKIPQELKKLYPLFLENVSNEEFVIIGDGILTNSGQEYIHVSYLHFDKATNEVITKISPGDKYFSFGLSLSKNVWKDEESKSWVIAANGLYDNTDSCSQCFSFKPYVYSLTENFDSILWETRFYDAAEHFGDDYSLFSINKSENGYIVTGGYRKNNLDSLPSSGLIFKSSLDGDSLWMKHYIPLSWEGDRVRWAKFISAEVLNDGSILAAGEIFDNDLQVLRPWILHVDADGCLIPGCNLVSTEYATSNRLPESDFNIFPNPAKHDLYIHCKKTYSFEVNVSLFSISGSLVKKSAFLPGKDDQIILSLDGLPEGMYTISISNPSNSIISTLSFYHIE